MNDGFGLSTSKQWKKDEVRGINTLTFGCRSRSLKGDFRNVLS